jgi:hypothetical protein
MRSSSIITLAALVGISMVSATSSHGKFDRRSHKALIADRQVKEAAAAAAVSDASHGHRQTSRKYKKRGGKICRIKDAAVSSSLMSGSSSATSTNSASSTAVVVSFAKPCSPVCRLVLIDILIYL